MRKITCLFVAFMVVFCACSSDDGLEGTTWELTEEEENAHTEWKLIFEKENYHLLFSSEQSGIGGINNR